MYICMYKCLYLFVCIFLIVTGSLALSLLLLLFIFFSFNSTKVSEIIFFFPRRHKWIFFILRFELVWVKEEAEVKWRKKIQQFNEWESKVFICRFIVIVIINSHCCCFSIEYNFIICSLNLWLGVKYSSSLV